MDATNIFIVEDDALVVSHLKQILQEYQYQVAGIAASGQEAISLIDATKPNLILMDIRLRGPMDGLETAKIISQKHKVPIIFLTAHLNKEYLNQAKMDGAFSYLLKPVRGIDLHTNIQMVLFRHKTEKRLQIVNTILNTRQKLNRFILEKTDRESLLSEIGQLLAESGVFASSLLITDIQFSQPKFYFYPEDCGDILDIKNSVSQNEIPLCIQKSLTAEDVVIFQNSEDICTLCPFNSFHSEHYHLSYVLKYRNEQYGVLTTFLTPDFSPEQEIIELFKELGDDLAFALHKFELEDLQLKAQKALEESEYKYRILSENALVGVFLVQNNKFKYVNPQMAKIFKYQSPTEILHLNSFLDLCHPDNRPLIQNIFEQILTQKDKPLHIEFTGKDKNDKNIEIELLASRINYQGQSAILGSLLDITEKKEKDQIIHLLSTGMEASPVGIFITDIGGKIEYVNPAFCKITGYERDEIIGEKTSILKSGETPDELYSLLWNTILKGETWTDEIIDRKKDGSMFWVKMLIVPIKNDKETITHFLAIQEDITDRKKLEQQLLHSQKMEAIGRLAGGVAHDFNNLLTVINGYAQLLLYNLKEDDPHRKKAEQIFQAGEKAKNLTSQLLAFSRKQMRQARVLNLNEVINSYLPMLKSLLGENIIIDMQLDNQLWPVEADAHQLEQILLNLIVNAKQAMPDGGKLSIITQNFTIDESFVEENAGARPGDFVRLSIADTGVGMDEEILKHIFEPFFTTRGVGEGTGLGLSTVYGIVKQNEGLIYVSSAPQHGTLFDLYFPRVKNGKIVKQQQEREDQEILRGNATVLLVEDDADVRKLTARALSHFGFKVHTARDGKEALQILNTNRQQFDLLITDLVMPNLDGKKLAAMIHEKFPDLPVLFISGYSEKEFSEENKDERPNFLQKPFSPLDLARKVKRILKKGLNPAKN